MMRTVCGAAMLWAGAAGGVAQAAGSGVLELHGDGVQIYRCDETAGSFAWTLVGPDAKLTDAHGKPFGRHFVGPSWQAADGSTIVGKPVASGSPQGAHAVPWLVLQVASHSGSGVFDDVSYVVRSHTAGGTSPAAGCNAARVGAEIRVPYQATYTFFGTK